MCVPVTPKHVGQRGSVPPWWRGLALGRDAEVCGDSWISTKYKELW